MRANKAHNDRVFGLLLRKESRSIKAELLRRCKAEAEAMLRDIEQSFAFPDGNNFYPVDTGNLRDATGVGVYADGRLYAYMPRAKASLPQMHGGYPEPIWGVQELERALRLASTEFTRGIWVVLMSAVPYAWEVNATGSPIGRGISYFSNFKRRLISNVRSKMT